ncbi:unnamed protein product, partial [Mesorhabditis belari]|uniref:Uncharacterized protein n=1 Tax=Mesorhabditis belari TaxID=2138241 RepID=A0AAF3EJV4_9BILA
MPGLDWIPGVSQLKSGFQLITLDFEGARQTQENFVKECPVVSQVTSVVQLATGDADGALETQKRCLDTVNNVVNGLPVIGHAKGVVHYIAGDTEGGNQAMNAASRSTVVIGSGVVAGITTGGLAAIPAGIAAGAAYDGTATLITDKPQGIIAACDNVIKNPNAGNIFDALFIPVADGMGGYAGGKLGSAVLTRARLSSLEAARAVKQGRLDAALFGEVAMTDAEAISLGQQINVITRQISVIERGTPQYWFDPKNKQVIKTSNPTAVPVAGYIDEKNPAKAAVIVKELSALQCDAILADDYCGIECAGIYTTPALKTQQLSKLHSQSPQGSINEIYPNVVVATKEDIDRLQREKRDPQKKQAKALYDAHSWLPVPMPSQFNYTSNVMPQLTENELEVLSGLQMDIYDFLRSNITYSNYRGETGNRQMMVVCVSSQLYPSDANFNDSRPIRTITTVFFKPIKQATTKHF